MPQGVLLIMLENCLDIIDHSYIPSRDNCADHSTAISTATCPGSIEGTVHSQDEGDAWSRAIMCHLGVLLTD